MSEETQGSAKAKAKRAAKVTMEVADAEALASVIGRAATFLNNHRFRGDEAAAARQLAEDLEFRSFKLAGRINMANGKD